MKGRDRFTRADAESIKQLLGRVRRAERADQKVLRARIRGLGFYISDFGGGSVGFGPLDFDNLVRNGLITITEGAPSTNRAGQPAERAAASTAKPRPARGPRARDRRAKSAASEKAPVPAAIRAALAALSAEPMAIKAAITGGAPERPGLYGLYGSAATWQALGLGSPPDGRPLYVGKAEDSLLSRDVKTHFATGKTGQSSPRRSFSALLAAPGALELVAIPRRPHDPEPKKFTHYALDAPGDSELTDWMCRQLRIAVWPAPAGTHLGTVEGMVMNEWLPPLNLIGCTTPWTKQVRNARADLAERAKEWARERGFDV